MKIKIYEDNSLKCLSCFRKKHTVLVCPYLHFIPDKQFLIKRFIYTTPQTRAPLPKPRKKFEFKSLRHLTNIQYAASKLDSGDECSEYSDESMEESIRKTEEEEKKRSTSRQATNVSMKNKRMSQLTFNLGENKLRQPGILEEIREVIFLFFFWLGFDNFR